MSGRSRRRLRDADPTPDDAPRRAPLPAAPETCWLCGRPLGLRVEWHHPLPKSRGGRATVPIHPICHRTLHAQFTNLELARLAEAGASPRDTAEIARFVDWVADKPADFHAPTRSRR